MLQILYERGFIDPNIDIKNYTDKGLKLADGNVNSAKSYKKMIEILPDFVAKQALLEYIAQLLGTKVKSSLKYHPEIAGEGIEFCWGVSKSWYRKQRLEDKKKKSNFKKLVESSMSESVLGYHSVHKCARRMRSYVLAYVCVDNTFASKDHHKQHDTHITHSRNQIHQKDQQKNHTNSIIQTTNKTIDNSTNQSNEPLAQDQGSAIVKKENIGVISYQLVET